jgi:hypothetical protein
VTKQISCSARVLGRNQLDQLQDFQGAKRDVFQIPDRRRHDVKHSFRLVPPCRPAFAPDRPNVEGHQRILSYDCKDGLSLN